MNQLIKVCLCPSVLQEITPPPKKDCLEEAYEVIYVLFIVLNTLSFQWCPLPINDNPLALKIK